MAEPPARSSEAEARSAAAPSHSSDAEARALLRLCARHGIATAYDDVFGVRHQVAEASLAALLRDAGLVAAGQSFVEADVAAESAARATSLPLVARVLAGEPSFSVAISLPAAMHRVRWRLLEEDGALREGDAASADLERVALPGAPENPEDPEQASYQLRLPIALPEGYHRLRIIGLSGETLLICAPAQCYQPPLLEAGGRVWGFTLQLHSLRSRHNWGFGDFGDLRRFVDRAAREGTDVIGLNPLHALFPHNPAHQSPYSPSSRAHLNVLYIDVEAIPDLRDCKPARRRLRSAEFQRRLDILREAPLVDHAGVAAAKYELIELLYARFLARLPDDPERQALAEFRRRGGEALREHALFEALQAHLHAADPAVWGWPAWPEAYRDPRGEAVASFAAQHAERIGFFEYMQFQAARQLEAVGERARSLGMAIGLYLDLAVSVDRGGSDTWRHRDAYALQVSVGAPPDAFNAKGQDWGLPPLLPERLRARGHDVFIEALRANMRGAGAIRIDHVMVLLRLFWIPAAGKPVDGSYVAYPVDELLAILALESKRHRCLVIGEDLGTVPDALRSATRAQGVQSYRLLYFERDGSGGFCAPADYPRQAVVAVSTHDLPTLVGWWTGHDLRLRFGLGLIADGASFDQQLQERRRDRERLLDAVAEKVQLGAASRAEAAAGRLDSEAIAAIHAYLAATPSGLMMVQLEDALAEVEQPNLPGTTVEQPNWQRRYSFAADALWDRPSMQKVVDAMKRSRPQHRRPGPQASGHRTKVPRATYRLQLHSGFGFDDAARIVPYLARLGISHVYCSPIQRARPGSMHGYDVVAHDQINPELGGEAAFERFTDTLEAHGMGQLIDLVPNHMGVQGNDNRWWNDVLENGMAARHAKHFDIDWQPLTPGLAGKVLLPLLGDRYGVVLAAGELKLRWHARQGEFGISYYEHRFPLAPESYAPILHRAGKLLGSADGQATAQARLSSLATAFERLPAMDCGKAALIAERARDKQLLKQQLAGLATEEPAVAKAVDEAVHALNQPEARDRLHALLDMQAYRLAHWRAAADEINYRRFFDVNELAALRTERRPVFEATHALALELAARGRVDGLRIDHPDGLQDPATYFERLQQGYAARVGLSASGRVGEGAPGGPAEYEAEHMAEYAAECAAEYATEHAAEDPTEYAAEDPARRPTESRPEAPPERPLYVVAEKIAAAGEDVPLSWAVHGTTGYRFANVANAVLTNVLASGQIKRIWRNFSSITDSFEEIAYRAKREVATGTLASDLEVLAIALLRIAKRHPQSRDYSLNTLREVLATVAASLSVYRSYNGRKVSEQDRRYVEQAVAAARERLQLPDPSVFDFVRDALLGRAPGDPDGSHGPGHGPGRQSQSQRQVLRFARRFQQYSAPVAAKGVEDTAFYRYFPLASANEVGGEPDRIGMTVQEFHVVSADRRERWPHTMLATSTHDNKRAEDVRLRIDVLSELPGLWRLALRRWSRFNAGLRGPVLPAHEYLLYQTLLGTMPLALPDAESREDYAARIVRYMLKAARESKTGTSWTHPEPAYEAALESFVQGLLSGTADSAFRLDLQSVVSELDRYGALNGISLVILKYCSPGVPDLYQGCELIDRSLVDPDNRRPVDYAERSRRLQEMEALEAGGDFEDQVHAFARTPSDGRAKLWLTWRLLSLRREMPELFRDGSYEPLAVRGAKAEHVIAFARRHQGRTVIVIALRLFALLAGAGRAPSDSDSPAGQPIAERTAASLPLGEQCWGETEVLLPADFIHGPWIDRISGRRHTEYVEHAERAEHAQHAERAERAEHAERAERAEHAEHAERTEYAEHRVPISLAALLRSFPGAVLVGGG